MTTPDAGLPGPQRGIDTLLDDLPLQLFCEAVSIGRHVKSPDSRMHAPVPPDLGAPPWKARCA